MPEKERVGRKQQYVFPIGMRSRKSNIYKSLCGFEGASRKKAEKKTCQKVRKGVK